MIEPPLPPASSGKVMLDEDAPLLEFSTYAGVQKEHEGPWSRLVTGIGPVCGVESMVIANESTVRGGAMNPNTVAKQRRALDIAESNRLPVVSLVHLS